MRKITRLCTCLWACASFGSLAGCASFPAGGGTSGMPQPTHLFFVQSMVVGVDVSVGADTNLVQMKIGYDRETLAFVPASKVKKLPPAEGGTGGSGTEQEAMSTVAKTKFIFGFGGPFKISEKFATGEAAINLAKTPALVPEFLKSTPGR